MKRVTALIFFMLTAAGLAQPITVSTTNHTVPQLVNNVLINSPCVSATNITWRTGSNFGSVNGIGFFTNTNASFPMQTGVVLSTGNALSAAGPNTSELDEGNAAWTGDAALEATLAAAGISMTSANATVLEFDFTPISPNFSFDFIFASEEYGNFQCQFSDAFAFLLTNVNTGVTTNLAVVPGTNQPISVVTIRDFLYNSSCPSANPQYFQSYNGGSNAGSSAINFNGQTVLMNASATLTPNVPYHIKLVIADRSDYKSDSAIFIMGDSFNIGQDVLGQDHTVSNGTALCAGQSQVLSTGLSAATYSFSWTRNGVTLAGETGPSLTITTPGTYGVTYTNTVNNCQPVTDFVVVEAFNALNTPDPVNLYKCDSPAAMEVFDLSYNTNLISQQMSTPPVITFHASQVDADADANPLPVNYSSAGNQTVFVRIENASSGCYAVKSFQLLLTPSAVANPVNDQYLCARSKTLNNQFFQLHYALTPTILGSQSPDVYKVSYYASQTNAIAGTNALNATYTLLTNQMVYAKVENITDPSCFALTDFEVFILELPEVDDLEDVIVCESYALPQLTNGNYFTGPNGTGTPLFAGDLITETQTVYIFSQTTSTPSCRASSSFEVKILDPLTMSPQGGTYCGSHTLAPLAMGHYYTQPGGQGTIVPPGTVITESQTLYYYFITEEEPFCVIDTDFAVSILPSVEVGTFADVFDCTSYTLPALTVGKYYTQPGGQGQEIPAGTTLTTSQTVYVYASSGNATLACTDSAQFDVVIGFQTPPDVAQCEPYALPALPIGNYFTGPNGTGTQLNAGTVISQSQTVYIHIPQDGNCMGVISFDIAIAQPAADELPNVSVCDSFVLPALSNGTYYSGPNATGTQLNAGDVISQNQTIYIFAGDPGDCFNQKSFTVTIIPPPAIDSRSDIDVCHSYVLTQLSVGNYYTGPDGTGDMLPAGTVITQTTPVYIYALSNTTPPCAAQNMFTINIFSIEADQPANVTACDSYALPALTIGNYYTAPDGPYGTGTMLSAGTIITTSTTLYVFAESGGRINCTDENSFTITINNTPVLPALPNRFACNSYTLPELTLGGYFTQPDGQGTPLAAGTELTESQTVYVYAQTGTTPNCVANGSFQVTVFNVDQPADVTTCESYALPALTTGRYYTGPGGTGTQLQAGHVLTATQTVYVYATSPFQPYCSDETSFTVTIIDEPVAVAPPASLTKVCDEDGTNDGILNFDLQTLNESVLGTQSGDEFAVTYYETMADALAGTNAITSTQLTTVYVKVGNELAENCFNVRAINLTIYKLPEPTPTDGIICFDTETQTLLNPYTIHSGLSPVSHTFIWHDQNGNIVGHQASYTAVTPGLYTVTAINNATGCASEPVDVNVAPSEPALVTYTISPDFASSQSITVIATGTGDYEYMLDNGVWQDSNVFENVSSGMHIVTVRDKNGCGQVSSSALVINYPHFFTPNGDGYNDTWNINDLAGNENAKITIFDRYGKYLKTIEPGKSGWDGTYNGSVMPSTDYWFVVNYEDQGVPMEFKAHFSMKR